LFPQTRGLIVSYAPNNYSSTMRCTKIRESVLCARLSTYDPLKIVAVSNSSTGNRRAKGGAKSAVSTGDNVSDTSNQQLYEGDDPEIIQDRGRTVLLRCPLGACGPNNTCKANRVGPVCGYCAPGAVMTGAGCGGTAGLSLPSLTLACQISSSVPSQWLKHCSFAQAASRLWTCNVSERCGLFLLPPISRPC